MPQPTEKPEALDLLHRPEQHTWRKPVDDLDRIEGLFVGQLDEHEVRVLNRAIQDGKARRSYEGGAGLMGVARVRLNNPQPSK